MDPAGRPLPPRTCDRSGCSRPARMQVGFRFWAIRTAPDQRTAENGATAWLDLAVCKKCRRGLTRQDVISPEGWQRLVEDLEQQARARPDLESVQLVWKPISQVG